MCWFQGDYYALDIFEPAIQKVCLSIMAVTELDMLEPTFVMCSWDFDSIILFIFFGIWQLYHGFNEAIFEILASA